MVRTRLNPYSIRIKNKKTGKYEDITNINLSGTTLKEFLENTILKYHSNNKNSQPFSDEDSKRIVFFEGDIKKKNNRSILFIHSNIHYGEFGLDRPIINKDRKFFGNLFGRRVKKEESPTKKLAFTYFEYLKIRDRAFVILNSHSLDSYKTILERMLQKELDLIFGNNLHIEFQPIFNTILAEKIEKGGRISEMQFISHELPNDEAEHDFSGDEDKIKIEDLEKFTMSFKSKSKGSLIELSRDKINEFLEDIKNKLFNPKEKAFYSGIEAELSQIKVIVSLEGKSYPIVFDKEGEYFRESLYLDEKETIIDGKLNQKKINQISEEYAKEILKKFIEKLE